MNKLHHVSVFVFIVVIIATPAYSMDTTKTPGYTSQGVAQASSQLLQQSHFNFSSEQRRRGVWGSRQFLQLSDPVCRQHLYYAARHENANLFKAWLNACDRVAIYNCDQDHNSLMHLVCGTPESGDKVNYLILMGADIEVLNKQGQTPLQRAQQLNDTAVAEAIERLIEARKKDYAARIADMEVEARKRGVVEIMAALGDLRDIMKDMFDECIDDCGADEPYAGRL